MTDSDKKQQYMTTSLDDIVKANRNENRLKKGRGFTKNNSESSSPLSSSPTATRSESPKLNVLETSLDDIVRSQKKPYIKKSQNYQQPHQHQQGYNRDGLKVTINNSNNRYNNNYHQQPQQFNPQFQNRGLFNRNQPYNNTSMNGGYRSPTNRQPYNNRVKNIKRTSITDSIDHKFFDPRGIRDYSQVKKPIAISMNGGNDSNNEEDDVDEPEFDERGNELSFKVRVVNLPKSIIASDIAYMFGVIGSLKDFELDADKSTALIIFKKKAHALNSIERYSGVELDGSLLILHEDGKSTTNSGNNSPLVSTETTTSTTTTSTTTEITTTATETSNEMEE